ncbi:MAG: ATP-binding protein [Sandaracinaceae bacterium]
MQWRDIIGPPAFGDRERQRRASTLYGLSATVAVGCVVWVIVTWINDWGAARLAVASSMALVSVGCMVAARRGAARVGSVLIVGFGCVAVTLHLVLGGPELAPTLGGFYVLVVAAGVLAGGPAAVLAAVFGCAVLVGFAAWDGVNMLPSPGSGQTEWDVARANSVALVTLGLLLGYAARRIDAAFRVADRSLAELEESNRALSETRDQMLRAQKMETVGAISGAIAHVVNNYLTVIDGYAALIADEVVPPEEHPELAQEILRAAERSARLTRQLLAFGRQQVFDPKPADLDALVADAGSMLRKILGEHRELDVELGGEAATVRVDASQIEQVLINLVLNARDAMAPGGTVTIRTACVDLDEAARSHYEGLAVGPHVELVVSDTGCGMDAETLSRALEPFFSTKGLARGTGLGLSSVNSIMERSGGAIRIYSEPGVGTTIRCLFPRIDEAPVPLRAPQRERVRLEGLRVLLVEDDDMVRGLVTRLLTAAGAKVRALADPVRAAEQAEDIGAEADVMVCDVIMPGLGGAELAERLHERAPELPVLFMSGYLEGSMIEQGILRADVELLQKPFTEAQLLSRVQALAPDARAT